VTTVTIRDLSKKLVERELSITIHNVSETSWVVWLFAQDDPALGVFQGESDDLIQAITKALNAWDGKHPPLWPYQKPQ